MRYPGYSVLLTDLYELTMLHGYFRQGMNGRAAFELFLHKRPDNRNFLIAAGLEQALDYLESFSFSDDECDWLAQTNRFDREFIDSLRTMKFTGDVYALPEGTLFFEKEPLIRIEAPLPEARQSPGNKAGVLQDNWRQNPSISNPFLMCSVAKV